MRGEHNFTATDGVVKAYAAFIDLPNAPLLQQWWAGIQAAGFHAREAVAILVVTNNGKVWSYALRPRYVLRDRVKPATFDPNGVWTGGQEMGIYYPTDYVSRDLRRQTNRSRDALESGYREPVAWALRDLARRAKHDAANPAALQLNVAYECEAPSELGTKLPGPCGPIQYTGYPQRIGSYALREIHDTVCRAITACTAVWTWRSAGTPPWKPVNLEIMLHSGNKALGLAYAPGTGHERNKRSISLNDRLFKEFAMQATWRVVVHELCHHYRDETQPRRDADVDTANRVRESINARLLAFQLTGAPAAAQIRYRRHLESALRTHDAIFVRELARVDELVAKEPVSGLVFTEYMDPSMVAEVERSKRERQAATAARIDWSPTAGRLHCRRLKSGQMSMQWLPLTPGAWRAPVVKLGYDAQTRELINRVIDAACTVENWPAGYTVPQTVREFRDFCINVFRINL